MVRLGKRSRDDNEYDEYEDEDESTDMKKEDFNEHDTESILTGDAPDVEKEPNEPVFDKVLASTIQETNSVQNYDRVPDSFPELTTLPVLQKQTMMNNFYRVTKLPNGKQKADDVQIMPVSATLPNKVELISTSTTHIKAHILVSADPQLIEPGAYQPPALLFALIRADTLNAKLWNKLLSGQQHKIFNIFDYRTFVEHVLTRHRFRCTLCPTFGPAVGRTGKTATTHYACGLMVALAADKPVTCPRCRYNYCQACVEKRCRFRGSVAWERWKMNRLGCPNCDVVKEEAKGVTKVEQVESDDGGALVVNEKLAEIFKYMNVPRYVSDVTALQ